MGLDTANGAQRFSAKAAAVPRASVLLRRVLLEKRGRDKRCGAVAAHVARRCVINLHVTPPVGPRRADHRPGPPLGGRDGVRRPGW